MAGEIASSLRIQHERAENLTRHRRQVSRSVERVSMENTTIKAGVWHALRQNPIDENELIGSLKIKPILNTLFTDPLGGGAWEGRTLEEHAKMVLAQSKKYIRPDEWENSLLSFEEFNLMLSLHDIGKPIAVQLTGSTREQNRYTPTLFQGTLAALNIDPEKIALMQSLVTSDSLLGFIDREKQVPLEEVVGKIKKESTMLGVNPKEYAKLRRLYQLCDSSSYTKDAPGGEYSHDGAFSFGKTNSKGQPILEYSPDLEEKWQKILQLLPLESLL